MGINESTKIDISLKTLVTSIIAIIFWVMSIAGVYFTLKAQVDSLENQVKDLKHLNLESIKAKVDLIYDKIGKL